MVMVGAHLELQERRNNMFLNTTILKRLMKEAWKGAGLTVGKENDELFLFGGYWIVRAQEDFIPNTIKGLIVELAGELPQDGTIFKTIKDCGNQYELQGNSTYNIIEAAKKTNCAFAKTNIFMKHGITLCRVLQNVNSNKTVLMNNTLVDIVDPSLIDEPNGETEVIGPTAETPDSFALYWHNNVSAFLACIRTTDAEKEIEFLELLEGLEMH